MIQVPVREVHVVIIMVGIVIVVDILRNIMIAVPARLLSLLHAPVILLQRLLYVHFRRLQIAVEIAELVAVLKIVVLLLISVQILTVKRILVKHVLHVQQIVVNVMQLQHVVTRFVLLGLQMPGNLIRPAVILQLNSVMTLHLATQLPKPMLAPVTRVVQIKQRTVKMVVLAVKLSVLPGAIVYLLVPLIVMHRSVIIIRFRIMEKQEKIVEVEDALPVLLQALVVLEGLLLLL
ncbi:MAG: hypothetical protein AAB414_05560 [Patescibacteria group bacterium]